MLTWAWARDDGNMCEYGARECGALTHARAAWKASGAEADAIGEMNTLYSFDFIRMRQRGPGPWHLATPTLTAYCAPRVRTGEACTHAHPQIHKHSCSVSNSVHTPPKKPCAYARAAACGR